MAGMTRPTKSRTTAGPRKMTLASGLTTRPEARPAAKKMISRMARNAAIAPNAFVNLVAASLNADSASTTESDIYASPPWTARVLRVLRLSVAARPVRPGRDSEDVSGAWCERRSARPRRVDVLGGLLDGLALGEPCGHRLPLGTRADGGGHEVGGVEPERGVRVGQVLRGQRVDRVGVQALVDARVG